MLTDYLKDKNLIFKIIRSTVCEETGIEEVDFDKKSLVETYKLAKAHDLAHLLKSYYEKQNLLQKINTEVLENAEILAICRYERNKQTVDFLKEIFESEKIPFVLLKGGVIRDYYPEPWMRTSCDIDVLVKKEDLELAVQTLRDDLDYSVDADHYHDISLYAPSGVHIELHYELIETIDSKKIHSIQKNVWEWLKPCKDGVYTRQMIDEYFYFYQLAHMAKHFVYGGCGVRTFIDMFILNKKVNYDKEMLAKIINDGGLTLFDKSVKIIYEHWFFGKELPNDLSVAEDFVLRGGVYGNNVNKLTVKNVQHGKNKIVTQSIFPKLKYLKKDYPVLEKHKILYPFCLIARWCKVVFRKGGPMKNIKPTLELNYSISEDSKKQTKKMLNDIGLDKMMK